MGYFIITKWILFLSLFVCLELVVSLFVCLELVARLVHFCHHHNKTGNRDPIYLAADASCSFVAHAICPEQYSMIEQINRRMEIIGGSIS